MRESSRKTPQNMIIQENVILRPKKVLINGGVIKLAGISRTPQINVNLYRRIVLVFCIMLTNSFKNSTIVECVKIE
jgi:hypothetical protein